MRWVSLVPPVLLAMASTSVAAYELRWDGAVPVAHSASAQACTLSVWSSASDCPTHPGTSWRLVWASREPGAACKFIPEAPSASRDAMSRYGSGEAWAGLGGQVDTLALTVSTDGCPAAVARFQFTFPPNPKATVTLVVEAPEGAAAPLMDATLSIGDGPLVPPPAVILGGSMSEVGLSSRVVVDGLFLGGVQGACWISESREDTVFAVASSTDPNRAVLDFAQPFPKQPRSAVLVLDALGRGVAFPVAALTSSTPIGTHPRNPVVRFHPHAVDLSSGASASLEALVVYRPGVREALAAAGVTSLHRLFADASTSSGLATNRLGEPILADGLADIYVADLDSTVAPDSCVARLRTQAWVQYADASQDTSSFFTNDPLWSQQWNLLNTGAPVCGYLGTSGIDVGVTGAWTLTQGVAATRIGVIDSGVWAAHPDLPTSLIVGPRFSSFPPSFDHKHGAGVIGIISAVPDNNQGLAGIAPGVTVVSLETEPTATFESQAIQYCRTSGFPIINMSWGGPFVVPTVRDAVRSAFEQGWLLVAATGNEDDSTPNYPAAYRRFVTAVTAVLPDGRPWRDFFIFGGPFPPGDGNSVGPHVDLAAPGGSFIISTGDSFMTYWDLRGCLPGLKSGFGGTSAAAPAVSAVAGLLHSYASSVIHHELLGEDLQRILEATALDVDQPPAFPGKDDYSGWGLVRADQAIAFITPPRRIAQQAIGYVAGHGSLAVTDSSQLQTRIFLGVENLTDSTYTNVTVAHLEGTATFESYFTETPAFWVRSSGTLGWADADTVDRYMDSNDGVLVAGSLTKDVAVLRTTLYRIPGYGWFPVPPEMARIAYTAIGDASSFVGVYDGAPSAALSLELGPNPARGRMILRVVVPRRSPVRLALYDVMGREVRRLIDGELPAGRHEVAWEGFGSDGHRRASGVYFCRLEAAGDAVSRRVIYLAR